MSDDENIWVKELSKSSCAAYIVIHNLSIFTLERMHYSLDHGIWKHFPPEKILPKTVVKFGSGSKGFMTGTSGFVEYSRQGMIGVLNFNWSYPFIGETKIGAN